MKTLKYLSILFIALTGSQVSAQQINNAELQVTGLTCSMCSQATEKAIRSLDFVESIKADLNKNTFAIDFKKNRPVNIDLIRKKVQDAGFSIGSMTATFNFNNLKIDEGGQAMAGQETYQFLNAKSKTLNGEVKASIVDKNFVSGPVFKKKAAEFKGATYASGYGLVNGKKTRIFHLTI